MDVDLGFGTGVLIADGDGGLTFLLSGILTGPEHDGCGIYAFGRAAGQTTPVPPTQERKLTAGGLTGSCGLREPVAVFRDRHNIADVMPQVDGEGGSTHRDFMRG